MSTEPAQTVAQQKMEMIQSVVRERLNACGNITTSGTHVCIRKRGHTPVDECDGSSPPVTQAQEHEREGQDKDQSRSDQPQLRAGEADPRDDQGAGSGEK